MTDLLEPADPVAEAAAVKSRLGPGWPWLAASFAVALLVLAPVAGLVVFASRGSGGLWPHLLQNVLPVAVRTTVLLLAGVGLSVAVIGVGAAWLVAMFRFPGRRILEVALILPLAVPTYIAAYAYLDVTHPVGPVQTFLRGLLGISDPRGLWFPEIRSLGGAIFLLAFVLYPYVYLPVRALFLMQSASMLEVSRTLGAGPWRSFRTVALPLARPALVVGVSLAMLEALNDIGASEFLGVRTLTVAIYTTWVTRSSIEGAAQIALFMLAIVFVLILVEHRARRSRRYAGPAGRGRAPAPRRLAGWRGVAVAGLLSLPVLLGFAVPASYLVFAAARRVAERGLPADLPGWIANSVGLAAIAALVAVAVGLVLAYTVRLVRGPLAPFLVRVASVGYALPGTVLAAGLLLPLASLDNVIANAVKGWTGVSPGLLLTGSGAALVFAYVLRFLAVSAGGLEAGLARISPSIDMAARSLGAGPLKTVGRIHLPMLSPALAAAGLLVFVDCMKELPATLLLRPFNFETLATHVYGEAARGTYEDGAVAALAIVLAGLVPVALLARTGRR